jgi:bacterioferritin-associated ferredoxin
MILKKDLENHSQLRHDHPVLNQELYRLKRLPVIVCLCKGISDRRIREMAKQGQTLRQIITNCEAGTCCGTCASEIKELVKVETPSKSD